MTEPGRTPGPPQIDAGLTWLPAADRVPTPWRNGAGTTSEVVVRGGGSTVGADFDWRISIATVEGDGDFSRYSGVDRWLMPLSVGGLELVDDGTPRPVAQYEVHAFPGERVVASVGVTTSTLDLNLMLRRAGWIGSLFAAEVTGHAELATTGEEALVAVVLEGHFAAALGGASGGELSGASGGASGSASGGASGADGATGLLALGRHDAVLLALGRHDAVLLGHGRQVALNGFGRIAVARVAPSGMAAR